MWRLRAKRKTDCALQQELFCGLNQARLAEEWRQFAMNEQQMFRFMGEQINNWELNTIKEFEERCVRTEINFR